MLAHRVSVVLYRLIRHSSAHLVGSQAAKFLRLKPAIRIIQDRFGTRLVKYF
jgi:hypothetical protein